MQWIKTLFLVVLSMLVAACGGGGGGLTGAAPTSTMTLSPSVADIQPGQSIILSLNGGIGPYTVSSSNPSVIPIGNASIRSGDFVLKASDAVAEDTQITITVTDSQNKTAYTMVTVKPGSFTVTPGSLTLRSGATQVFTIHGGTAPYSVYSDKPSLVLPYPSSVTVKNGQFSVTPIQVASSVTGITLTVYDALGRSTNVSLSIDKKENPIESVTISPAVSDSTTAASGTASINAGQRGLVTVKMMVEFATTNRQITLTRLTNNFNFISNGVEVATVTTGTDTLGVAGSLIKVTNSTGSAFGIVRAMDNATGTYMDAKFMIAGSALTTVPDTVTLTGDGTVCGGSSSSVFIFGGEPPYKVTSTDTAVATVSPATVTESGMAFTLTGKSKCSSSGINVVITDSVMSSVKVLVMNIQDAGSGATPTTPASIAVWPSSAILTSVGKTATFTVTGGKAPYTVRSSQTGVATVAPALVPTSGESFTVTSVAIGSSDIIVSDSSGAAVTANVTVSGATVTPVVLNPASGTISVGGTMSFVVTGGTAPYTLTSSVPSIATVSPVTLPSSGGVSTVTGVGPGSTPVVVTDANGSVATFSVTVSSIPGGAPVALSPNSSSIAVGMSAVIQVSGGVAPYNVLSSAPGIATVTPATVLASNDIFMVNGITAGSVTVTVTDATGSHATGSFTITTSNPAALAVSPVSQTIIGGGKTVNFVITGGLAPYNLVSSQPSVATVPLSSTGSFSATTVAAGSTVIVITDASGAVVNASLTVQ